jgi:CRISPR system Cascade subunit CasB
MSDDYYYLNTTERKALQSWHTWLDDNRGDRARLRRAESPEDILLTDAFFHFLAKMPEMFPQKLPQDQKLYVSAAIAGLLSQVKKGDTPFSFARQLATPMKDKSKAPMSELRFQQLQKSPTTDDFYRRIIRAIIHWHKEFEHQLDRHPSNRLAVRWATDYFTALPKKSD